MLVVIDFQVNYENDFLKREKLFNKVLTNIQSRIRLAIQKKEYVVNLTTPEDGMTFNSIGDSIYGYSKTRYISKKEFDGSAAIENLVRKEDIKESIELAGLYLDVCVLETWKGLKRRRLDVLPINSSLCIMTYNNWRKIKSFPEGFVNSKKEILDGCSNNSN